MQRFLVELESVPWFQRLASSGSENPGVRRLRSWNEFADEMGYRLDWADGQDQRDTPLLEPTDSDNNPLLDFLDLVRRIDERNTSVAEEHGVAANVAQAVEDASSRYLESEPGDDFLTYTGAVPDEVSGTWEYTLEAHIAFIATEIVVAHLTEYDLLRQMWAWYHLGHWPCGWEGDWPRGRLIVF